MTAGVHGSTPSLASSSVRFWPYHSKKEPGAHRVIMMSGVMEQSVPVTRGEALAPGEQVACGPRLAVSKFLDIVRCLK